MFLVALASAKRIGELQALSFDIGFSPTDDSALLTYVPEFVSKTDSNTFSAPRTFRIPALTSLVGDEEDELALCPVRTLREYVERTKDTRGGCNRLFVSVKDPTRPLAKNSISTYTKEVILKAHQEVPDAEFPMLKVTAHEVRAVATSLLFKKEPGFTGGDGSSCVEM